MAEARTCGVQTETRPLPSQASKTSATHPSGSVIDFSTYVDGDYNIGYNKEDGRERNSRIRETGRRQVELTVSIMKSSMLLGGHLAVLG